MRRRHNIVINRVEQVITTVTAGAYRGKVTLKNPLKLYQSIQTMYGKTASDLYGISEMTLSCCAWYDDADVTNVTITETMFSYAAVQS